MAGSDTPKEGTESQDAIALADPTRPPDDRDQLDPNATDSEAKIWPSSQLGQGAMLKLLARTKGYLFEVKPTSRGWLVLAGFLVIAYWTGLQELFLPATGGNVYFDSPQIYTRERLVNDRFREQAWLNGKLKELDSDQNAISAEFMEKTMVSVVARLAAEADKGALTGEQLKARLDELSKSLSSGQNGAKGQKPLFDDNFEKQQHFRGVVRQAMIENELDDRHDLGSNSLFLFKFGAAIAPGTRTSSRLRITMTLKHEPLPSLTGLIQKAGHPCDGLRGFECGFVSRFHLTDEQRDYASGITTDDTGETIRSPRAYGKDLDKWEEFFARWMAQESLKAEQAFRNNLAALGSQSHFDDVRLRKSAHIREIERRTNKFRATLVNYFPRFLLKPSGTLDLREIYEPASAWDSILQLQENVTSLSAELENALTAYIAGMFPASIVIDKADLESLLLNYPNEQKEFFRSRPQLLVNQIFLKVALATFQCNFGAEPFLGVEERVSSKPIVPILYVVTPDIDLINEQLVRNCILRYLFPEELDNLAAQSEPPPSPEPPPVEDWPAGGWFNVNDKVSTYQASAPRLSDYRKKYREVVTATVVKIQILEFTPVKRVPKKSHRLFIIRDFAGSSTPDALGSLTLGSSLLKILIDHVDRNKEWENVESYPGKEFQLRSVYVPVPTGLFLFIQRMSKLQQSHSYSVTPRADFDLVSEVSANSWDLGASQSTGILQQLTGSFSRLMSWQAVTRKNRIVGYASESSVTKPGGETAATFGWVVFPEEERGFLLSRSRIVPANEDLSALVSLPAWWDDVTIVVSADWMDDWFLNVQPIPGPFNVELPIRLDLINKLLTNSEDQAPRVDTAGFWTTNVVACSKGEIVIPGQNLWRSTVVTLGGQKADLIEVLPDMSGIIAKFEEIELPLASMAKNEQPSNAKPTPLDLIVWTSEGHDVLTDHISVSLPLGLDMNEAKKAGKCPAIMPRKASPQ